MISGRFYDGLEVHREEKIVLTKFLVPHRGISTFGEAGGLRDDQRRLCNHRSCEPPGHNRPRMHAGAKHPKTYREMLAGLNGLPHGHCATFVTAADMRRAAIHHASFRNPQVIAACTGGVETFAGRAGDPASVYEEAGTFGRMSQAEPVEHETINTLVCSSRELTPGAMVRTLMTATEAETAALREGGVGSRCSDGLAAGTGTDRIGLSRL